MTSQCCSASVTRMNIVIVATVIFLVLVDIFGDYACSVFGSIPLPKTFRGRQIVAYIRPNMFFPPPKPVSKAFAEESNPELAHLNSIDRTRDALEEFRIPEEQEALNFTPPKCDC